MAADTDKLKLSVKPYIGMVMHSSAFSKTVLLSPSTSAPKNKAVLPFYKSNSSIGFFELSGQAATIL
jgi:hypothetical protein